MIPLLVFNFVVLTCKCRTVAVKLRDQAPVAVARVEGTEAYKSLMGMASAPVSAKNLTYGTWCTLYDTVTPLSVRDYLGYCRTDPKEISS